MKLKLIAVVATALTLHAAPAPAQDWPARSITLIVPFAAGGGIDTSARVQALALAETIGQTVVIENIGAAGGTVGTARAAKATPDGYTLLIGNSGTHAYAATLYQSLPYDPVRDFEPVGMTTDSPRILLVRKDLPVNNLKEFIAYTKANQAQMQYGSAGVGSGTHLPCTLLNAVLGVNVVHVPYRGAGPAMQDLVGGRLDYMCDTIQTGAEQAKGQGQRVCRRLKLDRLALGDVVPLPRPVVGEQRRHHRPVSRQEPFDFRRRDLEGGAERVQRCGVGDARPRVDRDGGDAHVAGVPRADSRVRLGEKAR